MLKYFKEIYYDILYMVQPIVSYVSMIQDLLVAGGNYEMTALETGVAAEKRVQKMEELQKRRRNGVVTGQGEVESWGNFF